MKKSCILINTENMSLSVTTSLISEITHFQRCIHYLLINSLKMMSYFMHTTYQYIPVLHHLKEQVKITIYADLTKGTITQVPIGTPTIWCNQILVLSKKGVTTDCIIYLQHFINSQCCKKTHLCPSPFQSAS